MGRKNKYETHVKPRLDEITEWYQTMSEKEIAEECLGISQSSFENYKKEHEELRKKLEAAKKMVNGKMKAALKKRGLGFHEKETKTIIRDVNGVKTKVIEVNEKYFPPDVGAIHLWLKNNDPDWRNDDQSTMDLRKAKLELDRMKAEAEVW